MEGRMTICNMSIEAGARSSLVAVDETTIAYLKGRPHAPAGDAWTAAVDEWRTLTSDPGAVFDRTITLDASRVVPLVTWGTRPDMVVPVTGAVPDPSVLVGSARTSHQQALDYMGLTPGTPIHDIPVDRVFIGSCTNARTRGPARGGPGRQGAQVAPNVRAIVVPGSQPVKAAGRSEGLARHLRAPRASSGVSPAARCASA